MQGNASELKHPVAAFNQLWKVSWKTNTPAPLPQDEIVLKLILQFSSRNEFKLPTVIIGLKKKVKENFPGGPLVKNPPANAGHIGLVPDPGRSHMLQSN